MALLGAWVCRLGVRPSEARCLSAAGLRSTVATAWLSVYTGCRACCCLSLSRCDLVRHAACHLAVGGRLLLLAADRLCHMLIFCCLRAWMAGIAARRSAATGISAAGLQAWADGLWPPLPIVGLRDGHDVNFMNEFLNSLCSLCVRLLPCLPMRTWCLWCCVV